MWQKGSPKKKVDYNEIFSLVVKQTSIRTILSVVVQENMELDQMDVKTTFLHGDLQEVIYMRQPTGFEHGREDNSVPVKEVSLWFKTVTETMLSRV